MMSPSRALVMSRSVLGWGRSHAMARQVYESRARLTVPARKAFAWHERPGAFARLTPPWERVNVRDQQVGICNGTRVELTLGRWPLRFDWILMHSDYEAGVQFRDVQLKGPFKEWSHLHRIEPSGGIRPPGMEECDLVDKIDYALPLNRLTVNFLGGHIHRRLDRLFEYHHRVMADDLNLHEKFAGQPRLKIMVSGSTGLVGEGLIPLLRTGGHEVVRLVRRRDPNLGPQVVWDPEARQIDTKALEGMDAVVHLAGENIVTGRWSREKKEKIYRSRVAGTTFLCEALDGLERPPKTLLCASAIGYYGNRGDEVLDEHSRAGEGFLAKVCREWEAASMLAREKGIRVVNLRIGLVLSPRGGALRRLLTPFLLGLGGRIGSGKQSISWIALDDLVGLIYHCLMDPTVHGPINAVAPQPVTNRKMTRTLAHVLKRPAFVPIPAGLLKLAMGEMAEDLLLASTRVLPKQAQSFGYTYRFPRLEEALRYLLGRGA